MLPIVSTRICIPQDIIRIERRNAEFIYNCFMSNEYVVVFHRAMGLYVKCLARMLFNDGKQFAMVYLVIMFSFGGSIFLALKGASQQHSVKYVFLSSH